MLLEKLYFPKTNALEATVTYARLIGAKISEESLNAEIKNHPEEYSLLNISDALTHFGIENVTVRFSLEKLLSLEIPFIAQTKQDEYIKAFSVGKVLEGDLIGIWNHNLKKWDKISPEDFRAKFTGIALVASIGQEIIESDFKAKTKTYQTRKAISYIFTLIIPFLLLLKSIFIIQNSTDKLALSIFMISIIAGCTASFFLIWIENNKNLAANSVLCTNSEKTNCDSVINSSGSKILGFSLSHIGFVFFVGSALTVIGTPIYSSEIIAKSVSMLVCVAIPFPFYSIYYQKYIVGQWCTLCLAAVFALVSIILNAILNDWIRFKVLAELRTDEIFIGTLMFLIPVIGLAIFLPVYKKLISSNQLNKELSKLKHNRIVFESLLKNENSVIAPMEDLGISLGNPTAKNRILKVCNPYCIPCSKSHFELELLLKTQSNFNLQIIYTATNNEADRRANPVRHFLALKESPNLEKALDDWYSDREHDYQLFSEKYPVVIKKGDFSEQIEQMDEWCKINEIDYTPTIFVNGKKLPAPYTVKDLRYYLES